MPKRWALHLGLATASSMLALWLFPASKILFAASVQSRGHPDHSRISADVSVSRLRQLCSALASSSSHVAMASSSGSPRRPGLRFDYGAEISPARDNRCGGSASGVRRRPCPAAVLAPPPSAVLLYELAAIFHMFFAHGNIRLPRRLESRMRWLLVTPELHRIHHSDKCEEHNSNLGGIFLFWDRPFGTYRGEPAAGRDRMKIGLPGFQGAKGLELGHLLALPFRRPQPAPVRSNRR